MKPIAFKVRGGGNYSGTKGGAVKPNEKGGAGYLGYEDKTFTIATSPDQWICTTINNLSSQPIPMNEPAQPAPVGKPLRYLSVCSGMEAASVAWHPLGWTPVGFSEIEPFPCSILKHRFPNIPNYGSLTEHHTWPIEQGAIDLLVGGTPCQSFSVAGLRKGLADPRGNLALTFLALADRLKPRWVLWENVPGALSSSGGRDFGSFLGALVELGYGFAYRVLDAQHFGVPQRRRRVFVVACLGDWRAPAEVLSLREGLRGYLEAGGKKRKGPAADAGSGVETSGLHRTVGTLCADTHPGAYSGQDAYTGRLIPSHWEGGDIHPTLNQSAKGSGGVVASNQELFSQGGAYLVPGASNFIQPFSVAFGGAKLEQIAPTIMANGGPNRHVEGSWSSTQFTGVIQPIPIQDGREMEKNQNGMGVGNPGDPAYTIDTTGAQAAGIPFRKSKRAASTTDNETWVPADVTNTLNNFDLGDTRTTHAVVEPFAWTQNQREEVRILGDKAAALALPGTHKSNYIAEPKIYENHAQDSRVTGPLEVAPTVAAKFGTGGGNVPLVSQEQQIYENSRRDAVRIYEGTSPTLQSFMGTGGCNVPMVQPAMAVRRLTPVECERLQGFPDNWSRIPWKGKPETECPDGPRYKACGNSMAVPVMRWIGERIAAVEASSHA